MVEIINIYKIQYDSQFYDSMLVSFGNILRLMLIIIYLSKIDLKLKFTLIWEDINAPIIS